MEVMEGMPHALGVALDLVQMRHVNSVTLVCTEPPEKAHTFTVYWDDALKSAMVVLPQEQPDA